MNGWQRIWFVLTLLMVLYAVGFSYFAVYTYNPSSRHYRQAVLNDLKSPSCQPYVATKNLGQLSEPAFSNDGGTCWHIYTSRKYRERTTAPYTIEVYDTDERAYRLDQFGVGAAMFSAMALVASALLYLAGYTVNWIRRGFRKG